jgi:DNA (cytosine-5)-methyltransferase 1
MDDDLSGPLCERDYKSARHLITHSLRADGFDASEDGTGRGTPIVPTLTSNGDAHSGYRDEHGLVPIAIRTAQTSANGHGVAEDVAHTLDGAQGQAVAFRACGQERFTPATISPPITATDGGGAGVPTAQIGMAVRRLTPRECERLQGLPDDYTLILYNGKPAADGTRYKAIGNGMAVPVMRWIGERIQAVERNCDK